MLLLLVGVGVGFEGRVAGQSSGSGYLARVGPAALRIAIPLPPAPVPVVPRAGAGAATNVVAARTAKAGSGEGGSVPAGDLALPSPEEFLGPPVPLVIESPLPPRVTGKDIYPPVAPVESSTVVLAGVTNPPVITAQMLVRFFRQPAIQAAPATGPAAGTAPGVPPPPPGLGTETSLYLPVQFAPPVPSTPLSSTATYTLTPNEPQGH
jgi:hypothetical protein